MERTSRRCTTAPLAIMFVYSVYSYKQTMHGSHSCLSSFEQAVVTLPLRSQSAGSPIQVQASRGQASLTVPGLASAVTVTKPQTSSPASPAHNPTSPAVLQGVSSQNIIKQVQADSECIRLTVSMGMHNISVSYCLLANVKKSFYISIKCWISTLHINYFPSFYI